MSEYFIGTGGVTFSTVETNMLIGLCEGENVLPAETVNLWASCVIDRSALMGGCSVFFLQLITPVRLSVFPELFPLPVEYPADCPAARIGIAARQSGVERRVVDLSASLRAAADKASLIDAGSGLWSSRVGAAAAEIVLSALAASGCPAESLAPDEQTIALTQASCDANAPGRAFLEGGRAALETGARLTFGTRPAEMDDGAIIVFDDGFLFDHHRTFVAGLARRFHEIHLVCSRDVDFSYIARVGATTVLSAVSIATLARPPLGRFHLDAAEWHYNEKLRETNN